MKAESISIFADYLNPARFFGPIFDKELRVSSRRERNYLLRSAYVVLLAVFVLYMWLAVIGLRNSGSATYQISRSSQMGRQVIIAIVWFQFIISQLLAIVMLSSSISDEIRRGTLNVLMTTPVNSFQIVVGKLFSNLLQILLLLALSLPLLAIIRVFGGIPWSYVVYSFFITLSATIFAGSLSLFLSVFSRYAYRVIITIIVGYVLFFGILPYILIRLSLLGFFDGNVVRFNLTVINPFRELYEITIGMASNSMVAVVWSVNCLFLLSFSCIFLALSIWKIRHIALGGVFLKHTKSKTGKMVRNGKDLGNADYNKNSSKIKHVTGSPIIWKENYKGFWGKGKIDRILTMLILLFCVIGIPLLFVRFDYGTFLVNSVMSIIYLMLIFRLAIATAGSIASEKEARTLPILLLTPLDDRDIVLGKVKAGILKNMPLLLIFLFLNFLLLILYVLRGVMKPPQLMYQLPIALIGLTGLILFITGSGSYFGVRMKNSTAAIAATIGSLVGIYIVLIIFNPVRLIIMFGGSRFLSNPVLINIVSIASSLVILFFFTVIGLYLLKRSIRKLRHNIF